MATSQKSKTGAAGTVKPKKDGVPSQHLVKLVYSVRRMILRMLYIRFFAFSFDLLSNLDALFRKERSDKLNLRQPRIKFFMVHKANSLHIHSSWQLKQPKNPEYFRTLPKAHLLPVPFFYL
jgi:hypothetical protein